MHILSESTLLEKLKTGDSKAVSQWFSSYHDRIFAVALQKISNTKDAEELTQQTFINCLRQMPLFRGASSLWTWMNAVLRHEIADYYRKKYAKNALRALPLSEFFLEEKLADSQELSDKVALVLSQMSVGYSELLQRKYIDKAKVKEIAVQLGTTVKAVESDLFRAREEFKFLWLKN